MIELIEWVGVYTFCGGVGTALFCVWALISPPRQEDT